MSKLLVTLRYGMSIYPDSWNGDFSWLQDADAWDKYYFGDRITHRLPSPNYPDIKSAVRIEVTGRTLQQKFGNNVVRGKVTWLTDDGENEQSSGCWIMVRWNDFEFVS